MEDYQKIVVKVPESTTNVQYLNHKWKINTSSNLNKVQ